MNHLHVSVASAALIRMLLQEYWYNTNELPNSTNTITWCYSDYLRRSLWL